MIRLLLIGSLTILLSACVATVTPVPAEVHFRTVNPVHDHGHRHSKHHRYEYRVYDYHR